MTGKRRFSLVACFCAPCHFGDGGVFVHPLAGALP